MLHHLDNVKCGAKLTVYPFPNIRNFAVNWRQGKPPFANGHLWDKDCTLNSNSNRKHTYHYEKENKRCMFMGQMYPQYIYLYDDFEYH